ncbi:MAG: hypothetical protein DRI01_07330 [Chloroflexi bacterium]|nr:MAG: hypothetical protein DRI01_07330 [Chloroflexota bacterium]
MQVEELTNEEEWEHFVATSQDGTFYHSLKWKRILEDVFGLATEYIVIRDSEGRVAGICPLALTRGGKLFNIIASLPHSDFGGPIFREGVESEAASALRGYLIWNRRLHSVAYARIRCSSRDTVNYLDTRGAKVDASMGTMNLDLLETSLDDLWNHVYNRQTRQRTKIRRVERDGFQSIVADKITDLKIFYQLYHHNMTHIGASPHSWSFFQKVWDLLYPEYFNVILIANGHHCIGGQAFFIYPPRKAIYKAYIGIDRNASTRYQLYFYLSWSLLKWAESQDLHRISFGGTPANAQSVNYTQKRQLGAIFHQDYIMYIPIDMKQFLLRQSLRWAGLKLRPLLPEKLKRRLYPAVHGL